MKLRSVRYLTGEGIKNVWVNRLMSIASVGVLVACMLIIGVAIALSFNIDLAMGNLEQQNVIMVYFEDEAAIRYSEENMTPPVSSTDGTESEDYGDVYSGTGEDSSEESSSEAEDASSVEDASSEETASAEEDDTAEGAAVAMPLNHKVTYTVLAENDGDSTEETDETSSEETAEKEIDLSGAITEEEAKEICKDIEKLANVVSAEFISSEEGLQRMLETMDENEAAYFTWLKEDNPLSCAAKVTMENMENFDQTVAAIEAMDGISTVYHQRDLAMKINSIKNGIGVAGVWIIALLMVISLVIVSNTIRVTMYNRKLEISIMKAVGATDAFIRLPFIVEGVVIGLVSALVSTGLLYFVYHGVVGTMQDALGLATTVPFRDFVWPTLGLFAGIGVLAGLLGSSIMITKYLRKEGSEFRAL